jgi:hypothetical protein
MDLEVVSLAIAFVAMAIVEVVFQGVRRKQPT